MKAVLLFAAAIAFAQSPANFTATGPTALPRRGHTATLLADGRVLIAGGWAQPESVANSVSSAEVYDPLAGTFAVTGSMASGRRYHTATLLPDGRVLIAGGTSTRNDALAGAEVYEPASGQFRATGAMAKARSGHMAALLPNGKVLVAGGIDGTNCSSCPAFLVGAEIYDPVTGTFSPTADMPMASYEANTAVVLADGKVFIGGGRTSALYDSAAGVFATADGWSTIADDWPDAQTLLTNGKVLVTGGDPDGFGSSAFAGVYDPGTGKFAVTGRMNASRDAHTATMLPDGTALIAGGQINGGQSVWVAELYDPAAGGFTPAGSMITGRCCHTATLLNSGQVLIIGGISASQGYPSYEPSYPATAELYNPAVLIPAPILFSLSPDGKGQGAIWDGITGKVASPSTPAVAGQILAMYTGAPANRSVIPPKLAVGGHLAQVLYFGDAPGYPGYGQLNFRVPDGVTPGPGIPVRLIYLGRWSNEVTMAIH